MAFIIIVICAIYIISIVWIWNSLQEIEKPKKVIIIAIGFLIIYLITLFVFAISKGKIEYKEIALEKATKNILIATFTGLNSFVLPFVAKLLKKLHDNDIEKEEFTKKIVLIALLFIVLMFFESGYLNDTQKGILKIYSSH